MCVGEGTGACADVCRGGAHQQGRPSPVFRGGHGSTRAQEKGEAHRRREERRYMAGVGEGGYAGRPDTDTRKRGARAVTTSGLVEAMQGPVGAVNGRTVGGVDDVKGRGVV